MKWGGACNGKDTNFSASPDHGMAYAIAGQNKARPGSMRAALFLAAKIAKRRKETVKA